MTRYGRPPKCKKVRHTASRDLPLGSNPASSSALFKFSKSAEQRCLNLRGAEMIAKVITGVQFKNGVEVRTDMRQEIAD